MRARQHLEYSLDLLSMAKSSRSTTSSPVKKPAKTKAVSKAAVVRRSSKTSGPAKRQAPSSDSEVPDSEEDESREADEDGEDEYRNDEEDEEEDDVKSLHSDALDDDDQDYNAQPRGSKKSLAKNLKRKRVTTSSKSPKKASPKKKKKKDDDDEESELELEEGQEIVGVVVQAPKTGRVPPGQVSQNTFDFLSQLRKPECNDRQWFKLHEPVYRLAEKEWKDFIDEFTPMLVEVDPHIPHLPSKDVIHRIYRDLLKEREKGYICTLSCVSWFFVPLPYYLETTAHRAFESLCGHVNRAIRPGGESLIAAGAWCPGKNELNTIRHNLLRSSRRLRSIISSPDFVRYFGKPEPRKDGGRQNVFGGEDELKVAPKGVEKTHKDIDLLKCRSFAVIHKFTDKQTLSPNFREELCEIAKVVQPFVHCLNDLMTLPNADGSDSDDEEDGGEAGDDEDEE